MLEESMKEATGCRAQSMREMLLWKLLALVERSGKNLFASRTIADELYGPQAKADDPERKKPVGLFHEMLCLMSSIQENLNQTTDILNRLKEDVISHTVERKAINTISQGPF